MERPNRGVRSRKAVTEKHEDGSPTLTLREQEVIDTGMWSNQIKKEITDDPLILPRGAAVRILGSNYTEETYEKFFNCYKRTKFEMEKEEGFSDSK